MEYKDLEGAFVRLKLVGNSKKLTEDFQNPDLRSMIGMNKTPTSADLDALMTRDKALRVWEMYVDGKTENIGYAFTVFFDGPPFVAVYTYETISLENGKDCIELLIQPFFETTEEPALFLYILKPVDEEVHSLLVEAGFDHWDENPTIDNDQATTYILERHTYEAYYGDDDEDGEFDEFDDY